MGTGTDATDPGGYPRHLLHWAALAELLKAPELRHLKVSIDHIAAVIKEDLYPAVAFKPGYGIDGYFFRYFTPTRRFLFSIEVDIPNR